MQCTLDCGLCAIGRLGHIRRRCSLDLTLLASALRFLPRLQVGEAAGVKDEALRTVDRLRARLRRAAGQAAMAAAAAPARPRVLVLQSLRPLRTVGWWLPDQVMLAGGSCLPEEQAGDAPLDLTWQQVSCRRGGAGTGRLRQGDATDLHALPAAGTRPF